jgi:alpha-ketoglutarate-dependent 2,4-dichlorophenoxyacetate dioxygenase
MPITIKKLHPLFCAEIGGVDTGLPVDDATFGEIRAALDEYSVLVFPGQSLDDERQVAFSRRFGPLETSGKANPAVGTHFARQSNLDIETGTVIPADDRRMIYQGGAVAVLSAFGAGRAAVRGQHRIRDDERRP